MRRLRLGGQGVSLWTPQLRPLNPALPKRETISGWTSGAARRNRAFLMSVDPINLGSDLGYAATLTLGATPLNAVIWGQIVHRFLVALRRLGAIRYHWVVEWTRKGRPHLHITFYLRGREPITDRVPSYVLIATPGDLKLMRQRAAGPWSFATDGAVRSQIPAKIIGPDTRWKPSAPRPMCDYFTDAVVANAVFLTWQRVADPIHCNWRAQHVERIDGVTGWLRYVAKHCARGVDHYQRASAALPSGWTGSGRLWGRGGDWPTRSENICIDVTTYNRLRRGLRRWLRGRAASTVSASFGKKREQALRELRYLRSNPRSSKTSKQAGKNPRKLSSVSGLSTFAPRELTDLLLIWAVDHPSAVMFDIETGEIFAFGPQADLSALHWNAPR